MKPGGVIQLTVEQLAERLAQGLPTHLLDVRQPWEHEIAALPNSQLVPLNQLANEAETLAVPDEAILVVYCHHGIRSLSAAGFLQKIGFLNVVSLAGGIDAWSLRIDPSVPQY